MVVFARKSKLASKELGGKGRKVSCSWYSDAAAPLISATIASGMMEENNIVKDRQVPASGAVQGFIYERMWLEEVVRVMVS